MNQNINTTIANNILLKINLAEKILIVASKPIDYDSIGTALAIEWWLKKLNKKDVYIYAFAYIPESFDSFPLIKNIIQNQMSKVDFDYFDLIILPDGNSFKQFFTNDYDKYSLNINLEKIINIDHHELGELNKFIPDYSLRIIDSCTSKVFYDYFIKPSQVALDQEVSTLMYMSLIGDTGTFTYGIYSDTFLFANLLINNGVDHFKAVDFDVSKKTMDFLVWAIEHTEYYPDIKSTILYIDEERNKELISLFGKSWDKDNLDKYYKSVFMRMVENFPYSIILESRDFNTRSDVSWRTKNVDTKIEILKVLQLAGFKSGGHRNAGGGSAEFSVEEARERFIGQMKMSLIESN